MISVIQRRFGSRWGKSETQRVFVLSLRFDNSISWTILKPVFAGCCFSERNSHELVDSPVRPLSVLPAALELAWDGNVIDFGWLGVDSSRPAWKDAKDEKRMRLLDHRMCYSFLAACLNAYNLRSLKIGLNLMDCERFGWNWKSWGEKIWLVADLDLGRIKLRLTNTLNSHTGPRNAIQGSTDCCMNERTKDCRSQKKACWRKHLLASYSSSTAFAQLLEHPIQTERLCETMNFNNEFAGTSYQHSQSTSTWP